MTTGTLLSLTNTSAGNNAGIVLDVNNSQANAASFAIKSTSATTGSGYGIYSSLTGVGNTCYGIYGVNAATGTAYGVLGGETGAGNTGYAIWGNNKMPKAAGNTAAANNLGSGEQRLVRPITRNSFCSPRLTVSR
jgi:hypothetical protein